MANENNAIVNTEPREQVAKPRTTTLRDGVREQKAIVNQAEKGNVVNTASVSEIKFIAESCKRKLYKIRFRIPYFLEDYPTLKTQIYETFFATENIYMDIGPEWFSFYRILSIFHQAISKGSLKFSDNGYIFYEKGLSQGSILIKDTSDEYYNYYPGITNSRMIKKYQNYYRYTTSGNPSAITFGVQLYERDTTNDSDTIVEHFIRKIDFDKSQIQIIVEEL